MKKVTTLFFLIAVAFAAHGQIFKPVTWSFSHRPAGNGETVLVLKAAIDPGWHVYSQHVGEGGPIPTSFTFTPSPGYELIGEVEEKSEVESVMDPNFGMEVLYFSNEAVFEQRVKLKQPAVEVKGTLEFMVCDDTRCLPPTEVSFSIPAKSAGSSAGDAGAAPGGEAPVASGEKAGAVSGGGTNPAPGDKTSPGSGDKTTPAPGVKTTPAPGVKTGEAPENTGGTKDPSVSGDKAEDASGAGETDRGATSSPSGPPPSGGGNADNPSGGAGQQSLLGIFIAGFLGGLLALIMPCIFPMIPLTVSYFTKRGEGGDRGKAIGSAILYGVFIVVVYVALGLLITVLFGSGKLNELASNGILNMFFFIILVVFAISFLGAFEITLPSSWTTFADKKADSRGLTGIFFMAVALGLASFSCTGPIIGTLLVEAASKGALLGPATGMFGFSLALAIPFTLFAVFPQWLRALPKSGGWLNTVKVSLGFLELAFAMKFLSTVDMAYHWNLLDRDIFLALWIVIFGVWGLYLLGKVRFAHDSPGQHLSVPRLFFAVFALGFTVYLVPGLWGAPLKPISSFLPHQGSQDFDMYTASLSASTKPQTATGRGRKYTELFHAPLGLTAFFDYEEGLDYAKKVNKPVFIDFTGWSCTNCRRMEASVWPDPRVLSRLRDDFVLVQLYVDDKTPLPEEERYVSGFSGIKVDAIGKKWTDFQASRFNTNSQPYYVITDHQGQVLVPPRAFDLDIDAYVRFLDAGIRAFEDGNRTIARSNDAL